MSIKPENEGSGFPADNLPMNSYPEDPYTFIKAERFFKDKASFQRPFKVKDTDGQNTGRVLPSLGLASNESGAAFVLNDNTVLLIQFIRPKVWRIRYDATHTAVSDYSDWNSRVSICDTLKELHQVLDTYQNRENGGTFWKVKHSPEDQSGVNYYMQSVQYGSQSDKDNDRNGTIVVTLYIQRNPLRMIAVRPLEPAGGPHDKLVAELSGQSITDTVKFDKIIWETVKKPLRYKHIGDTCSTILTVKKPGAAKYIGFGEQGGKSLFKSSTFMNYFDYDNMMYDGVYGRGPLDEREPLYHSEPFWIELNTHQNLKAKTATFVDNYSQTCIDFGKTNSGKIRTGTRFGALQYYVVAGNDIPDIIENYTLIVGRPKLKPRYILGYHQGCYGGEYETKSQLLKMAGRYRDPNRGIPLDGIHIDVDLQDDYRTFTTSDKRFPDARDMFTTLRNMGIKCSTNITPVISCKESDRPYPTLQSGLEKGYFVKDIRKTDDLQVSADDVRYIHYEGGIRKRMNPSTETVNALAREKRGFYPDPSNAVRYDFRTRYNSEDNYQGGVYYGSDFGTPGFYPDLNRLEVRNWWGEQYTELFDKGLEFVWQDMTSPCVAPSYGDMKGFPFRLMINRDAWTKENKPQEMKTVMELWALYSFNLHKATYMGLNELPQRKREGKRNFIIGRGSFAGMHRYAGLWTGDNASTWDHFKISVAQVLASGLSGVTITGADVGGFMPDGNTHWADPELLIRWYCAYFMLPWFRNHYHAKKDPNGNQAEDKKYFQEPFIYTDHFNGNRAQLQDQEWLYLSVEPVCRYYVQLRYTLLQLLYDAMFENLFSGLPIARSLVVTDTTDEALFTDASHYLSDEYMVRNDLLVCPVMDRQHDQNGNYDNVKRDVGTRQVYLPQPDNWYVFNLRTSIGEKGYIGKPLEKSRDGGSTLEWDASINYDFEHVPYITPMFVREGGIIPQIRLRQFVPGPEDKARSDWNPNPITIHVYPGKDNRYTMYLDDGVSRNSSPKYELPDDLPRVHLHDPEADDMYREVHIEQQWAMTIDKDTTGKKLRGQRTITVKTGNGNYGWDKIKKDIGDRYTVVLWHAIDVKLSTVKTTSGGVDLMDNTVDIMNFQGPGVKARNDENARATVVNIPVQPQATTNGTGFQPVQIVCEFQYD